MTKRRRVALIWGLVAALLVGGAFTAWQVHRHHEHQEFVAELQEAMEEDAASAAAPNSDLGEKWAIRECAKLHPDFEHDDAKTSQNGDEGDVYLYSPVVEDRQEMIQCDAEWVDDEWVVTRD